MIKTIQFSLVIAGVLFASQALALSVISVEHDEEFIFQTKTVRLGDRDCLHETCTPQRTFSVSKIQSAIARCYQEPIYKSEPGWGLKLIKGDGVFGPITKKVVMDFQNTHDLIPDGIVGLKTRMKLFDICTKTAPNFYQYQVIIGKNE